MKNKFLLTLMFVLIPIFLIAKLNVYFDCNRFPAANGNTTFEITYKIFDSDIDFTAQDNILMAQLHVNFNIYNAQGQELYNKDFIRQIRVDLDKTSIYHDEFFIDKMKATVTPGLYKFSIDIQDRVNEESITWEKTLNTLNHTHMNLSDIEISSFHQSDSTAEFQDFKRNNVLFLVNPNHLFDLVNDKGFTYYFEVFQSVSTLENPLEGKWVFTVQDRDQNSIYNEEKEFSSTYTIKPFWKWVSVSEWKNGAYSISLNLYSKDNPDDPIASRDDLIFIQENQQDISQAEIDKEYRYAKYFLTNYEESLYENLDDEGRVEFLKRFWEQNDPNPKTEQNEYKEEIIRRVNYANRNFSHYGDGWKSDRGRIYIRQGKPEEVIDKSYEYDAKPYIIWKYYIGGKRIYVFVDFTKLGNYKLVYVDNDDFEFSVPDWEDYLGPYFDKSELQ
ncbi:MAG: GWxTD domain-containing protein [Candidatus Cloacimonetes bacterium]|nr:GWxTD domain-containing protein [Candidatus Cloacimonadota bacterium]